MREEKINIHGFYGIFTERGLILFDFSKKIDYNAIL